MILNSDADQNDHRYDGETIGGDGDSSDENGDAATEESMLQSVFCVYVQCVLYCVCVLCVVVCPYVSSYCERVVCVDTS